jgi:hypothetical protein
MNSYIKTMNNLAEFKCIDYQCFKLNAKLMLLISITSLDINKICTLV